MPLKWVDAGELCERHTEQSLDLIDKTPDDVLEEVNRRKERKGADAGGAT